MKNLKRIYKGILYIILLGYCITLNSYAQEPPKGLTGWQEYINDKDRKFENLIIEVAKIRFMINEIYRKEFGEQAFYELMLKEEKSIVALDK